MSRSRPPRLPPIVEKELEGLDWTWQQGTKHWHLLIDGRMVALHSYGSQGEGFRNFHLAHNLRAQIRRFKRSKIAA